MKLFKMIEILKDKENWTYKKHSLKEKVHVPTGISTMSGMFFWDKDNNEIYDVGFFSYFIISFYLNIINKHLNKDKKEKFDEIYYNWIDTKEDY